MRSTAIGNDLPIPTTILFNRPTRGLLSKINRTPLTYDYDNKHFDALKQRQQLVGRHDTGNYFTIIPIGSAVAVQREGGGPWTH